MSATFPIENTDAAEVLASPATGDSVLIYDATDGKWKLCLVSSLQAVSGWTA